ncbi:uncharacterized protein B0I36DRAFT_415818 [Microdochium trichocladiopsis]|uniref:F-box domain-containing protein n=1 Tax=Microdochium trichocladiopsis TaxID=1682393 RepID=A0A9P8XXN3_9PEZI|nr:uncharacterized protein B0I36DRAFT_415818 [Microdochium trichocladiopsis]KAH7024469.1 hypothetical protein B0I36DRAFT_415818 [Microdochium trichocladiopsis]
MSQCHGGAEAAQQLTGTCPSPEVAHDAPSLGFLSLPPEVRNTIYALVCQDLPNVWSPVPARLVGPDRPAPPALFPPVLAFTCRQVYRELIPLFYAGRYVSLRLNSLDELVAHAQRIAAAVADHQQRPRALLPWPALLLVQRLAVQLATPASVPDARRCIAALETLATHAGPHVRELNLSFEVDWTDWIKFEQIDGTFIHPPRVVKADWLGDQLPSDVDDTEAASLPNPIIAVELNANAAVSHAVTSFRLLDELSLRNVALATWPAMLDQNLDKGLHILPKSVAWDFLVPMGSKPSHLLRAAFMRGAFDPNVGPAPDGKPIAGQASHTTPTLHIIALAPRFSGAGHWGYPGTKPPPYLTVKVTWPRSQVAMAAADIPALPTDECHQEAGAEVPMSFLSLPSEIRNQIYALVFPEPFPDSGMVRPVSPAPLDGRREKLLLPGEDLHPEQLRQAGWQEAAPQLTFTEPLRHLMPALTFTSKQVYRELAPLWYTSSTKVFTFNHVHELESHARLAAAARADDINVIRHPQPYFCHAPVHLIGRIHLFILTPTTQQNTLRWIEALRGLAAATEGHLKEFRLNFNLAPSLMDQWHKTRDHIRPHVVCPEWPDAPELEVLATTVPNTSAGGEGEGEGGGWRGGGRGGYTADTLVELTENIAFARAVAGFRCLQMLVLDRVSTKTWPAVLDRYLGRSMMKLRPRSVGPARFSSAVRPTFRAKYEMRPPGDSTTAAGGTSGDAMQTEEAADGPLTSLIRKIR